MPASKTQPCSGIKPMEPAMGETVARLSKDLAGLEARLTEIEIARVEAFRDLHPQATRDDVKKIDTRFDAGHGRITEKVRQLAIASLTDNNVTNPSARIRFADDMVGNLEARTLQNVDAHFDYKDGARVSGGANAKGDEGHGISIGSSSARRLIAGQ